MKPRRIFFAAGSREFQMREAEIDGNTASLLFFQTILHQCR